MKITEALAELKTIEKRIVKKREYVKGYLVRQEGIRDPHEKNGGSMVVIDREMQAVADLEARIVQIRTAIQRTNNETPITILSETKTIAEWLTWRKEVAPQLVRFLAEVRQSILQARAQTTRQGGNVLSASAVVNMETKPTDLVVNVSESDLAEEMEQVEEILGTLDGQLSMRNATVEIGV